MKLKKKKGITFPLPFLKTSRKKLLAINLPTDAPFLLEGHCALLLFYLPFIMIVFQVQNVHLQLANVVLELPNAVERILKGTIAAANPGGGPRGSGSPPQT